MLVENPMRSSFFLALRSHREQSRAFVDHNNVIVEVNDFESMTLDRFSRDLLARSDSDNVTMATRFTVTARKRSRSLACLRDSLCGSVIRNGSSSHREETLN
ncbi:MAG: hypothetical protein ABSD30_21425 [Candidatus Binatus sp.]